MATSEDNNLAIDNGEGGLPDAGAPRTKPAARRGGIVTSWSSISNDHHPLHWRTPTPPQRPQHDAHIARTCRAQRGTGRGRRAVVA